ncbi:MAG: L,D-transpeptidase [Gammaproteobacteria bacterium]|nr:L,D-transpeptidase [Gammaproteobacteria bacterium]
MSLDLSLAGQQLRLLDGGGATLKTYNVSTARNGAGERNGSECTPRGAHCIRARIGAGCPVNTVFRGRRPTGEIYSPAMRTRYPERDWILTRILWLSGLEPGFNRLGDVDTMRRFIYIHGAPDDDPMGVPGSHGCVKMRNADVLELFELVPAGTPMMIREQAGV